MPDQQADSVLCANVVYDVFDIVPFIRKLESSAGQLVLVLANMEAPANQMSPFWPPVHGETRVDLPGGTELMRVLQEMDIDPSVKMFDPVAPESVPSREVALHFLRSFLYVKPHTEPDHRLQAAMTELVVANASGYTVKGSTPRRSALLSWRPG